jgi:hypothetical protein
MSTVYFNLADSDFSQDWSNPDLITTNDNWDGVPSIVGFRGDNLTGTTGVNPQTVTGTSPVVDVNANQTAVTFNTGGVTEFALPNPTVALAGSGTARAPYLAIYLNASGRENIVLSFNARDLETTDNAVQPIAAQYRLSDTGSWIDLPQGYVADATAAGAATLVTPVRVTLPADANNAATLQVRIMTTDAVGNDEWVGIDDIVVTSEAANTTPLPVLSIGDAIVTEGDAGAAILTYTVQLDRPAGAGGVSFDVATADGTGTAGEDYTAVSLRGVVISEGQSTYSFTVAVQGDTVVEANETLFVNVTSVTGATIGDGQGVGTIVNDDVTLSISGGEVAEGNDGTVTLTYTVTASGPAPAGGIRFDIATVDGGTATAGVDYAARALTSQTIAAGQTSYSFTVTVNGDNVVEANETVRVALSNVTGATVATASATGTIVNDDAVSGVVRVFTESFGSFAGAGFAPLPTAAQLDSDVWRVVGLSDNANPAFGGTYTSGDFARGRINGSADPTGGGVYSPSANGALILQPTGSDFEGAGFIEARVLNSAGSAAERFDLAFDWAYRNSGDRSSALTLSYSTDGLTYIAVDSAGFTTPTVRDATTAATFAGERIAVTLTDLIVADGGYLYLRWSNPTSSGGGSRDEIGIDNVTVDATKSDAVTAGVADVTLVEGTGGTTDAVFVVTRSSGVGSASIAYATTDGTARAGSDYLATTGTVTFAEGETSKEVRVAVIGDETFEPDETFTLTLSNPVGVRLPATRAAATITNDDSGNLSIMQIQGDALRSAYAGLPVTTLGIVTAVDTNGFWIQDPTGDGDVRTSDAVLVFTGTAPTVRAGDAVTVSGTVTEFGTGLTLTEITGPTITIMSRDNALPAATLIGVGGRTPPTEWIEDDGLTSYDPATDGIDFWESLEGMRVTIDRPLVVSNTTSGSFRETDLVASLGQGATGVNDRGGITISPSTNPLAPDYNPEKIQLDTTRVSLSGVTGGAYTIGDELASVTGIVNYGGNRYEVLATEAVVQTKDVTLGRESTTLTGDADHLSILTYNMENLDPGDGKYDLLASDIVYNLRAPDIIAAQEIQDADGAGNGANLSGTVTAQGLIDAIFALSGKRYGYVEVAPSAANDTGGEPGGNIRNGYFYNLDRVSYVVGSAELIEGPAYAGTRRPLVAEWTFNGQSLTTINVHFTSRGGSDPLWGGNQPPVDAGDAARFNQAAGIKAYVNNSLAGENVVLLGDWNGFYFERAQTQLTDPGQGGVFTNLAGLLPEAERYSYLFEGNAQLLDNILVTGGLVTNARYDAVHLNSQITGARPTDHDPQLALLYIPQPNAAPTALSLGNTTVAENQAAGTVVGTLAATDRPGDVLTYTLVDDAGGRFAVDAATGVVRTTAAFDFEAQASYAIVAKATDQGGLSTSGGFTVAVTNVNEAPVAAGDAVAVNEDAATGNLWTALLANDRDPDAGDTLTIRSVDTSGTRGSVRFDNATQTLVYTADADAFHALAPGETTVDRFTYTVIDAAGLTSTAVAEVTVTGIQDGVTLRAPFFGGTVNGGAGEDTLYGGLFADTLNGNDGNDYLFGNLGNDRLNGGNGSDVLFGDLGNDVLNGGAGDDWLFGGLGSDTLTGGAGADRFHFGRAGGSDTITDFNVAEDRLVLDGLSVRSTRVADVNRDGINDTTLSLSAGTSVTLLGVTDARAIKFAEPGSYANNQPGLDGVIDGVFDYFLGHSVRLPDLTVHL